MSVLLINIRDISQHIALVLIKCIDEKAPDCKKNRGAILQLPSNFRTGPSINLDCLLFISWCPSLSFSMF